MKIKVKVTPWAKTRNIRTQKDLLSDEEILINLIQVKFFEKKESNLLALFHSILSSSRPIL